MNILLEHTDAVGIEDKSMQLTSESLSYYLKALESAAEDRNYDTNEASVRLPFDAELREEVINMKNRFSNDQLKYVVVIGIGGSNLGTMAIYDALRGSMDGLSDNQPKLLFLDTVSPEKINAISSTLRACQSTDEFVILSISKSGGTTETIANTDVLLDQIKPQHPSVIERLVVITDEGSKFWLAAEERDIARIAIPNRVGGRYSVFSAVGLVPLALVGIDIEALCEGARKAIDHGIKPSLEENRSLFSASATHLHYLQGISIHNTFLFAPELESVGKWYRQLVGESLGKEQDLDDNKINAGITPIVSIGSTDLHSMAQLYYGGPRDKFTNVVTTTWNSELRVPNESALGELVQDIGGKSIEQLMEAIVKGVESSYEKNSIPFFSIRLPELSEKVIGYYLQFRMIEVMMLAQLMNLNAFDQPNVESYKNETRHLLKEAQATAV